MRTSESGLKRFVWTGFAHVLLFFAMKGEVTAQFLDITLRQKGIYWRSGLHGREYTRTNRCIIGTNSWVIRETGEHQENTITYDGTRLRYDTLVVGYPHTAHPEMFKRNHPEFTERIWKRTRSYADFPGGSPFRSVRVADAPWDSDTKIAWIAFASGEFLRRPMHQLYPPWDMWKQSRVLQSGHFEQEIHVFEDALGLPARVTLYATNRQAVFQYVVSASTNLMSCTVPLRFRAAQYAMGLSNSWHLAFSAEGEVTSLQATSRQTLEDQQ